MKKHLLLLLSFFCIMSGFGQNKIVEKIQNLQKENTQFSSMSVLTVDNSISKKDIDKAVRQATLAKVDINKINQIASGQFEFLELEIPYLNQNIKIQLYRVDPFVEDFRVDTDKNINIYYQKGVYYRGIIKGNLNSVSAFNFFNGEFNGIFSSEEFGNIVVGKIDKPNNQNDYIVYSDTDFLKANDFQCHVKENEEPPTVSTLNREVSTVKCVTFYFEIDYNLFQENGNSTTTTANWMTSVFNNVQTLFANDGITTALKSIFIWTNPDIYNGAGSASSDYLYAFAGNRPVFNGDVGMLVGIDPGGLGGVAFLNQVCNNLNYAYADIDGISVNTVPVYSWTTQVITHEFGHSLGSNHTHACVWNGNNTSIDGCGSQAGYSEGSCAIGPIPSASTKGTIMSYCHLVPGVGINFANGFGPQPSTLIANTVNSKSCLSTDCINTCINTIVNIQKNGITDTTAAITWEDLNSEATSWQISVRPYSSPLPMWNTVTQTSFQASGLLPNTYYKIKIRPVCTVSNPKITEAIFATSGNYCASMPFYDTGGFANNYSNLESFTRTLMPNLPNKKIVVTFTEFALEDTYDFLYVYDGPDDSYPELNFGAGFTGADSPGTITSTAVDGSLTFKFISDQLTNDSGWRATVSCEEHLGIGTNDYIDFTYYPNPTKNNITLKSNTTITEIEVFNIEGRRLFTQKLEAFESNVDLSQFASGTYFFKVRFNDVEKNFKILKM